MTIAVSTVARPSRILLAMVGAMSVMVIAIGVAIGVGEVGELSWPSRMAIAAFIVFLGVFGFCHGVRHRKTIHIDISGAAQIRLTELDAARACIDPNRPHVRGSNEVFRLLPDTTIWPHLLLLRLQADNGKREILVILSDCVSRGDFRALSVACRWIAAHNNSL